MEETMELSAEAADQAAAVESEPAAPMLPEQDLIDFVRDHPGLDAKTIPQQVWQEVRQGDSLSRAYGRHEVRQLREQNRQLQHQLGLEQFRHAAGSRSLGSMRSVGGNYAADSFLAGFNED